ncbi:MAG TPA: adenylyltransferase/cytidyltransferase family protein [Turneriella sp.]|nr:adenylyltransferase/cytidyltransferase family protein [Turneriella sp.]HNL09131.1 adenylyltransferase/cytidyltransferase family protein [Turneriella sp.]HNM99720.1 adenylyltransferase/cytidyltransferase family protein [Turneriella sp.]
MTFTGNPVFFFGGTFDPPHAGHKAIVIRLLKEHAGARVIVSPAPAAPLRTDDRLFSYRERFALLRACFRQQLAEGKVILSRLEFSLPKPNFTFDTLAALVQVCGTKSVIVIGADQAAQIGKWHRAEELMREYEFVVFAREGTTTAFDRRLRHHAISDFDLPVSATVIRASLVKLPKAERFAAALALAGS